MLVHTSSFVLSDLTSKPILVNFWRKAAVDAVLVLLQNRKGTAAFLSRCNASRALGVGVSPICSVPERSIRIARNTGRCGDIVIDQLWQCSWRLMIKFRSNLRSKAERTHAFLMPPATLSSCCLLTHDHRGQIRAHFHPQVVFDCAPVS